MPRQTGDRHKAEAAYLAPYSRDAGSPPKRRVYMFTKTFRSAMLVIAALGASSVAPAQVAPLPEPLIGTGSTLVPAMVVPQTINPLTDRRRRAVSERGASSRSAWPAERQSPKPRQPSQPAIFRPWSRNCAAATPAAASSNASPARSISNRRASRSPGQLAVGQVIANRSKSGRFPSSYCGVVFQRSQFSFVRGRSLPPIPRSSHQWKTAVAIAQIVDQALHVSTVPKALFFHARRVSPRLAPDARRDGRESRLLPLDHFQFVPVSFYRDGDGRRRDSPALLRRFAADRGRCRARRDAAVLPPGSVRDLRSAAAQRPARRHDGDRRQGRADDRRDQGRQAPTSSATANGPTISNFATASSGRCRRT